MPVSAVYPSFACFTGNIDFQKNRQWSGISPFIFDQSPGEPVSYLYPVEGMKNVGIIGRKIGLATLERPDLVPDNGIIH
jgi:hypothetical protein